MTVYVDDAAISYGRMLMHHMLADTDEELHAMADIIGISRRYHQAPPKHDSHYDVSLNRRAPAIRAGAVEITVRQAAAMNERRKVTGSLGSPDDAWAWLVAYHEEQRQKVTL